MIIIKRYPNRKLYNTSAKQYVTLEGVASLIKEGEEVQILDHASGEDLTTVTLTQIIFEQEKKEGGFLPRSVLTGLVQSGGQTLSTMRRTLASPLNLRLHVDLEIERRLKALVDRGEIDESDSQDIKNKLLSSGSGSKESTLPSEDELEDFLVERGIPTREDVQQLNQRLDDLFSMLDEVELGSDPESSQGE